MPVRETFEAKIVRLEARIAFFQDAVDYPFTEEGQELLRKRLSGIAKAVAEECEPGSREFCLAGLEEFALAYRSLRHDHDAALARAEAAEARVKELKRALIRSGEFAEEIKRGTNAGDAHDCAQHIIGIALAATDEAEGER